MIGIHYSVDGSDPTLTSPVYTKPISYHKEYAPIRAAVYYPDARSQIIEWDYGRAETNRERIRNQSGNANTTESPKVKDKRLPPMPETAPTTTTFEVDSSESKESGKEYAILLVLAMGIGGIILICMGWPVTGCILTTVAGLSVIGMFQDKK